MNNFIKKNTFLVGVLAMSALGVLALLVVAVMLHAEMSGYIQHTEDMAKKVRGLEHGVDLPKHMAEHIYMFSGPSITVHIKTTADMMSELTDWFGTDFRILSQNGDEITARITCNENAISYWALQYGPYVEILKPESLRKQLRDVIEEMYKKYQD